MAARAFLTDVTRDEGKEEEEPPEEDRVPVKRPRAAGPGGADGAAGPGPGRPKKKSKGGEGDEERRVDAQGNGVSYRSKPSQDVLARISRAMPGAGVGGHRLYLIQRGELVPAGAAPQAPSQDFTVLGATGNVYTVRVCRQPSCTCPDAGKGNVCKHLLFVMLRVLKQPVSNPAIWQKALLTSEVQQLLESGAAPDAGILADEAVRQKFAAAAGGVAGPGPAAAAAPTQQRPIEGDCPICCEEMAPGGEAVVFCATCFNNLHQDCFGRWRAQKLGAQQPVTCVYCRAPWMDLGSPGAGPAAVGATTVNVMGRAYLNLAQHSAALVQGGVPTLDQLYPNTAPFIQAQQGTLPLHEALNLHGA